MLNWIHEGDAILALRGSVKAAVVINLGALLTYIGFFAAILAVTSLCLRHISWTNYRKPRTHGLCVTIAATAAATVPWALTGVRLEWTSLYWLAPQLALWLWGATWLSQVANNPVRGQLQQSTGPLERSTTGRT